MHWKAKNPIRMLLALLFSTLCFCSNSASSCDHRRVENRRSDLEIHLRAVSGTHRRNRQQQHMGRDAGRPEVLLSDQLAPARRTIRTDLETRRAAPLDADRRATNS